MRFGLKDQVIQQICTVLSHYPTVEQGVLYGSRAKGCHKSGSDIDLSLQGDTISAQDRDRIILALDDLDLPYTFDVNLFRQISNEELRDHIERVGVVLYQRGKGISEEGVA